MSSEQNKALIERVFASCFNKRNYAVADEIIDASYVNHNMPVPLPGPEGFKAIIKQFVEAFPDMQIHIKHAVAEGNVVATYGYWTGTNKGSFMGMPATGKEVRAEYMDFWKLVNGKATENWVLMDNVSIMQQLGVMQEPK